MSSPLPTCPNNQASRGAGGSFARVIRTLGEYDELTLDELGPRIRVDYAPDGEHGREWFRELLEDLSEEELVELLDRDGTSVARLER